MKLNYQSEGELKMLNIIFIKKDQRFSLNYSGRRGERIPYLQCGNIVDKRSFIKKFLKLIFNIKSNSMETIFGIYLEAVESRGYLEHVGT